MRPELAKCLLDARGACRAISEFTKEHTFDDYRQDLLLRSAVERQFEILGEAFSRIEAIDVTFRDQLLEMGAIIGMRNRIIHGYDAVDDSIVWDAVQRHVPRLVTWLEENVALSNVET
jgi:uncharacterized protein with HEPN domain